MWRIIACTLLVALLNATAVTVVSAQYTEQELAAPPSGNGADGLGFSCDIDGDVMIVGAPHATVDTVEERGFAVIYRRDPQGNWVFEAELKVVSPDDDFSFVGYSVAIDKDTAVVGVPDLYPKDPPPTDSTTGAAFLFTYGNGVWSQTQKLAPDPAVYGGNYFGYDVAIDGDALVVSAPDAYDDFTGTPVFIYTRSEVVWTLQDVVFGAPALDDFGAAVAIEDDRIVVADRRGNPVDPDAYVYARTGDHWTLEAELHMMPEIGGIQRGWDVAISGDTILVSSWGGTLSLCEYGECAPNRRGSVDVFIRQGSSWTQQARIDGPLTSNGNRTGFGQTVAISGNVLVTTAPFQNRLFVYTRSGNQWLLQHEISAPEELPGVDFGVSVALSQNTAVVGYADNYYSQTFSPSTAYAYHFDPMAAFALPAMTNQTFHPDIAVSFSEPVTGLAADDFSVDGLSVSNVQGSGDAYTIDVSLETGDGSKSLFLPAGSVEDTSGTINAQSPTVTTLLDQTPPSSQALLADLTQAGSFVEGTYSANDAGSGIDTLTLYALSPAGTWTESTSSLVENGSITYVPTGGDGLHRIATVATDKVGNVEPAPSGNSPGDVALLWNDIINSTFTYPAAANGVYTFPMTTPLDVILDITGDAGSTTVSRAVGENAPPGFHIDSFIHETITITLGNPGASALVTWNAHPPNIASHTTPLNAVLQFNNDEFLHQYDLTIDGMALHFGPITQSGTFFVGDRLVIIGDAWMLY